MNSKNQPSKLEREMIIPVGSAVEWDTSKQIHGSEEGIYKLPRKTYKECLREIEDKDKRYLTKVMADLNKKQSGELLHDLKLLPSVIFTGFWIGSYKFVSELGKHSVALIKYFGDKK